MKKLVFILLGFISLNVYANGCGGEYQAATGTCRIIGPDGRVILYNSTPPQSGSGSAPQKIIRYTEVKVPPKYGALAFNKKTGGVAFSTNMNSKSDAQQDAIRKCERAGKGKCQISVWVKNGCIAAASGKIGSRFKMFPAAENPSQAESVAMNSCKTSGASECEIFLPENCSIPDVSNY